MFLILIAYVMYDNKVKKNKFLVAIHEPHFLYTMHLPRVTTCVIIIITFLSSTWLGLCRSSFYNNLQKPKTFSFPQEIHTRKWFTFFYNIRDDSSTISIHFLPWKTTCLRSPCIKKQTPGSFLFPKLTYPISRFNFLNLGHSAVVRQYKWKGKKLGNRNL